MTIETGRSFDATIETVQSFDATIETVRSFVATTDVWKYSAWRSRCGGARVERRGARASEQKGTEAVV